MQTTQQQSSTGQPEYVDTDLALAAAWHAYGEACSRDVAGAGWFTRCVLRQNAVERAARRVIALQRAYGEDIPVLATITAEGLVVR